MTRLSKNQITLLNQHVKDGLISKSDHKTFPISIYKYTATAQYGKIWDEMTLMSRGLILDSFYSIIARPFQKFFNLEELVETDVPKEPYKVYEKMDGSLGILYWYNGDPYISTAGSFYSDQAIWATAYLQKNVDVSKLDKSLTYLFEIIYPENRIVVDYKGLRSMTLLGAIDIETGNNIDLSKIQSLGSAFPKVMEYEAKDFLELKNLNKNNAEGFVIVYENGFRLKIKFEDYVRLHHTISNTTSVTIYEALASGINLSQVLNDVPDELYSWVLEVEDNLRSEFDSKYILAYDEYTRLDTHSLSRKEIALQIKDSPIKHLIFALIDGKDISKLIWKMIKPELTTPYSGIY